MYRRVMSINTNKNFISKTGVSGSITRLLISKSLLIVNIPIDRFTDGHFINRKIIYQLILCDLHPQ
jgi:hypothetical protein